MSDDDKLTEIAHFVFDLARAGDDERLAAYLDGGVPVDLTDADSNTLVMLAAYNGRPGTVRLLAERDLPPRVLHEINVIGTLQLLAVRLLAERGADVNRVNDRGQTPLAGAVFKADTEVVRTLLGAGADPLAGTPNAIETARMFQQMALLDSEK